jgi:hypothetical protein
MSPSRRWLVPAAVILLSGGLAVGLGPATAQQLPQPVVGRPGDLLANGGFDVGDRAGHPINWAVTGAADAAKVVNLSAYRTAGLCSLQIDTSAGASVTVRSERIVAAAASTRCRPS